MLTKLQEKYKCDKCSSPAAKHLRCGLLIGEALAIGKIISEIPYTLDDFTLCHNHLIEANAKYVHYTEFDLGQYHSPVAAQSL